MSGMNLDDLRDGYEGWLAPPDATFRFHLRDLPGPGTEDLDVHVFEETEDDPFVYLATAGISSYGDPEQRVELVLQATGRFERKELEDLARGLSDLALMLLRKDVPIFANTVLEGVPIPLFADMSSILLSDFNILSADYLPTDPPVCLLGVTPLFAREAAVAREAGDTEVHHRFRVEGGDPANPLRRECELPEAEGQASFPEFAAGSVREIWSELEAWFDLNARPTRDALRSGADKSLLERIESAIGFELPPCYRESLNRHDGRAYLTDYEYLSSAQVLKIWSGKKLALDQGEFLGREVLDNGGGVLRNFWWHPGWVPFAADSGGNLLCIDLAPGWKGVRGQIISWERASGPHSGSEHSFHEWLRRYRDDLLAGGRFEVDEDGLMRPV